ncbi:MAG: flagellar basal body P-ring formation chaperone FlgA [Ghiorsea sp.]|nr:flagellar basal body P-ring formation chaperone FlgA [Ghiorsea sp.]
MKTFATFFLILLLPQCLQAATPVPSGINTELQKSLTAFFAAQPKVNGAVAKLIKVQRWPDIKGSMRWSLPNLRFLPKRVSLIAEQGHGKTLRRWYVSTQVRWIRKVVTLKHDVSARTVLDRSMLQKEWKDIAGLRGQTWAAINDVLGLQTLRNMRRDDVIVSSVVKRPPLIKRGDHVTIVVKTAGIQVRAEGIALRSGSRGDRMLVQNIRSKQTLQSIVQDAHTVSISMGGAP